MYCLCACAYTTDECTACAYTDDCTADAYTHECREGYPDRRVFIINYSVDQHVSMFIIIIIIIIIVVYGASHRADGQLGKTGSPRPECTACAYLRCFFLPLISTLAGH